MSRPDPRTLLRTWFDDDDEVTSEIFVLGSLISSPPTSLDRATPLRAARDQLVRLRVPAIAVTEGDTLIGVVTRTDVLRLVLDQPDATVGDAISGFVLSLPASAEIEQAAALMAFEEVGQIVVTGNGGEYLGMVSALDIARHVAYRAGRLAS